MSDERTARPWPRAKVDLHVTQRIREYADIAYRIEEDADGDRMVYLRQHGETRMWKIIQEALADAGWKISHE